MPRRKKIDADDESSAVKRSAKKNRRVGLTVRVAKTIPVTRDELEDEFGEVIDTSDNLTQKTINENAISPETVEEIAKKIAELKTERDKRLLMWIGVIFIMSIVLIFWVYNLKSMFREQAKQNQSGSEYNIDMISEQLKKTMEEVNTNLNNLSEISAASSSLVAASSTSNFEETEDINQLRARLEELERRLNAPATTTDEKTIP